MKQFYFTIAKKSFLTVFLGIGLLLGTQTMQAATITSKAVTANWSTNTTWEGNVTPTAGDNVIIVSGASITINIALNMDPGTTITVDAGGTLKTTSPLNISTFDTLAVNGTYDNGGTLTVRVSLEGGGNFNNSISNSSRLNLSGPTTTVATLTIGSNGNTVDYNGGNQTIKNVTTYRKLITSGTGTKSWTTTIASTVQGLTINNGAPLNVSGNFTFTIGTTGSIISDALTFDASFNANRNIYLLTIDPTGSIIDLHPTGGTITVARDATNILTNNGTIKSNSVNINALASINNNGTITCNTFGIGTGTFTNNSSGIFNYNGATMPTTFTLLTSATGNTVNYGRSGIQTIRPAVYSNLSLLASGEKTIGAASSTALCTGIFSISGTATANMTNTNVGVDKLFLGDVGQNVGTYGFTESGATNINTTYFSTGTGFINVQQNSLAINKFSANDLKLYPNPSTGGNFTISLPSLQEESKVSILNTNGATVYTTKVAAGKNTNINLNTQLAAGAYLVKMEQGGKSITKKLIIN